MKILLTGHLGYVGSVMINQLTKKNFDVLGCDVGYYPRNFTSIENNNYSSLKKDIRDLDENDLKDCSAIIHLAALSNDPLGEINPNLTHDVNYLATINLAKLAKKHGVERFIYSSSCSIYGGNSLLVDENSELDPLTAYARSKVNSEKDLLKEKNENFHPVILRNATVYGVSPNLRLDLVVNNLVGSVVTSGKIKLLSDGTAWRPLLHIQDMANAFITALTSPVENVSGEIFNVGSNNDNYTVKEIAEKICHMIPDSEIEFSKDANKDKRSYKVKFDKISDKLDFKTKWTLDAGIKQIYETMKNKEFSESDFKDKIYYRVTYIKWLLENGILDNNLKFKN